MFIPTIHSELEKRVFSWYINGRNRLAVSKSREEANEKQMKSKWEAI
jgi:hypothetical protein